MVVMVFGISVHSQGGFQFFELTLKGCGSGMHVFGFIQKANFGIEDDVVASLEAGFPGFGWGKCAPYVMERMATHGTRRAAEMEEVARTLTDLGLPDDMVRSTTRWQRRIGSADIDVPDNARAAPVGDLASLLLSALKSGR